MGTIGLGLLVLAMLQTDLPAKPGPTTGATMNKQTMKKAYSAELEVNRLRLEITGLEARLERELANIVYLEQAVEKYQKLICQLVMDICPKVSE